jgi:predicted DNA-binding protein (UPF0251 family)
MRKTERPDEETLRRHILAGMQAKAIAARMGISKGVVWDRMRKMRAGKAVAS